MKKRILIIISALIAAVICAGFFVLMTESGLRWTFRQLSYAVSGLSARSIKGRLAGPLQIQGLLYKEPELSLELNSLNLNWDPLKLLTLKLHLTELDIEGVKIITSANETSAQTEFLPGDLHLPVAIEIGNATIKNILISDQDQQPFLIDSAVLSTSVNALSAEVHVLKIASPLFTASIKGDISLSENLPLDMFLEWEVYPEGLAAVKGKGRIAGSLKEFKIEQETSAPFRANLKGTVQNITQDIQWEASVTLAELLTGRVNAEWPDIHLTAGLQIEGTASKADIKGTFNARDSLYFGELSGYVDTAIDGGHISIKKIKISIPASNAGLEINGEYDLSNKASPLRIAADWNSLVWPVMTKEGRISSKKGSILLSGTPDKYDFQVNAFFNPENILESEWTLSGQGTDSGISVETFTAELLKGSLKGRGEIHWNPVMDWTIAFNGSHLNPGVIAKEWEGDISVDATASGSVDKGLTKMQVDLQRLEGRLRGHPLRGVIQADISGDTYTVKQFDIQSGSARLTAAGTLGKTSDIKWKIKAPDLGDLYPGGKGSIHGEGMIKGRSNAPEITVELAGKGIAAGAFKGEEIGIRASVNLDKDGESKLDLRAGKVLINNQGIDLLSLVVSGETAEHLITLNVISGKRDLSLRLKGSYLESIWKAQLLQTDLAAADFGQWSLRVPVDLYISADKAESGNLCLINAGSKVCMQSAWKKDAEIEGMFFLSRFPLPLLKTFFTIETELDGTLDGEAHIAFERDRVPSGTVHVRTDRSSIAVSVNKEEKIGLTFTEAELKADFDATGFRSYLSSGLSDMGKISGLLILPPLKPDINPLSLEILKGELKAEIHDLGFIPVFLPEIAESEGVLYSDIKISGRLEDPEFSGQISIDKGSAFLDKPGIRLEEIRIKADSSRGAINISGDMKSGEGRLRLAGSIKLEPEQQISAEFKINGENFEALKTRELQMLISPEINFTLHDRIIDVRGSITIPEASIHPRDLTGAVQSSTDVIIAGDRHMEKADIRWETRGELKVILGERVSFKGFGLTGNISGSLTAVEEPGKPTRGTGEFRITKGRYKAYGQDLDIEKGRIFFVGGAVENPGLDIRAVRKTGDVTAGIMVNGSLRDPSMTLFSVPSMDQSNALSYLLLGRPLGEASSSQGQHLVNAASSAGLSGGNFLAKKIGSRFGIEEIEIKEGETYEDASLYIGQYLSPRLYVGYGIGLFQPVSTISARYRLSRKWLVQGEHGLESGGDIIFQMER